MSAPGILTTLRVLKRAQPDHRGLRVAPLAENGGTSTFLAADESGRAHLLIQLIAPFPGVDDTYSEGVRLRTRELLDDGKTSRFMDLELTKPHLEELFSVIVAEVLEDLATAPWRDPSLTTAGVLERWRELLGAAQRPIGLERLTGLYGELWQLRELVKHHGSSVLAAWTGPSGARHDFQGAGGHDLEVKTSRGRGVRVVSISSLEQLQLGVARSLYLAAMRIEPVGNGGETARGLVDDLIARGCPSPGLAERLAYLGVTFDTLQAADTSFVVTENLVYRVDDAFPRLRLGETGADIVPGQVTRVRYDLDLTTSPPAPLSEVETVDAYAIIGAAA